ncbi:MAG: hypothetical protein WKF57_19855 [Nakamurella sp.]
MTPPPESPTDAGESGSIVQRLSGRTFALRSTFIDGGAQNLMSQGLEFTMSFSGATATVTGDCTLRYTVSPLENSGRLQLGEPDGEACAVGENPKGPPVGDLGVSLKGSRLVLGNDTAWIFEETG